MFMRQFCRLSISLSIVLLSPLLPMIAQAQSDASTLTSLPVIQGGGLSSPFVGQKVTTWGLVTGVTSDGFYLQDPLGDGNSATSDGLFAYTYDTPTEQAGACLQVAGEVEEYYDKTEL